ncbi:MAG: hypothetical protein R6U66_03435 [Bacteroidales bacterium]
MDKDLEIWIDDFQKYVLKHFNFLLDMGFKIKPLKRKNFEYYQDQEVEINYMSNEICVSISWFINYRNIGISIKELEKGKLCEKYSFYGDSDYGRAINVFDLASFISKESIDRPLPEILPQDSTKIIIKKVRISGERINDNFEKVIIDFANLLNNYAKEILEGDLSVFPIVQEYSKNKMEGN